MMLTEMQTDTELDRVKKELAEKEQAAKDIMHNLKKAIFYLHQQDYSTRKEAKCPRTGHW